MCELDETRVPNKKGHNPELSAWIFTKILGHPGREWINILNTKQQIKFSLT